LAVEGNAECTYDVVSVKDGIIIFYKRLFACPLGAGPEASIIQSFCKATFAEVEERFRNITSNSRFMTIEMKTDGSTGMGGFKLEYEMVADDGNGEMFFDTFNISFIHNIY
jgi:hypothetical protein